MHLMMHFSKFVFWGNTKFLFASQPQKLCNVQLQMNADVLTPLFFLSSNHFLFGYIPILFLKFSIRQRCCSSSSSLLSLSILGYFPSL